VGRVKDQASGGEGGYRIIFLGVALGLGITVATGSFAIDWC
jgi:hypothetical protein